ncbi:hypothetical protein [Clostridium sp. HBUAS56010]|uniref:hypothetical protein n=1 Tax=Clostridium sp. HBUAS56010 TaxID=2571127 RepID=UPI0011775515|nr:hypothetical protein [Clostridium sp. HBUAS56010]
MRLFRLPCTIGDKVYVLAECEHISDQLDGTLYEADGSPGTATGYYCPYEDNCPFDTGDFDSCETYKGNTAVFEDTVSQIMIDECGVHIFAENCCVLGKMGRDVFLSQKEAEEALRSK